MWNENCVGPGWCREEILKIGQTIAVRVRGGIVESKGLKPYCCFQLLGIPSPTWLLVVEERLCNSSIWLVSERRSHPPHSP